jgi:WASH complex subunit strumpellin
LKLRATFLKRTLILDLQLVRIFQAESTAIVDFVRVVPSFVDNIIQLKTAVLKDLPNRIERAKLKQFAQLEKREKLASLTKEISILPLGVLAMKTTPMGVITVDPKEMLEEGIRK